MPLHLILDRKVTGRCRVCSSPFYDTDSDKWIGEHSAACGQKHYEAQHPRRKELNDLLAPWDPELEAHMKKEYEQGRLKPSTERVS